MTTVRTPEGTYEADISKERLKGLPRERPLYANSEDGLARLIEDAQRYPYIGVRTRQQSTFGFWSSSNYMTVGLSGGQVQVVPFSKNFLKGLCLRFSLASMDGAIARKTRPSAVAVSQNNLQIVPIAYESAAVNAYPVASRRDTSWNEHTFSPAGGAYETSSAELYSDLIVLGDLRTFANRDRSGIAALPFATGTKEVRVDFRTRFNARFDIPSLERPAVENVSDRLVDIAADHAGYVGARRFWRSKHILQLSIGGGPRMQYLLSLAPTMRYTNARHVDVLVKPLDGAAQDIAIIAAKESIVLPVGAGSPWPARGLSA